MVEGVRSPCEGDDAAEANVVTRLLGQVGPPGGVEFPPAVSVRASRSEPNRLFVIQSALMAWWSAPQCSSERSR